jgi:exosome complex exonuclease RRP6
LEIDEASGAQVEIPYVHASQRPERREENDTIVVVGQVHQKRKRKAGKSFTTNQDVASSTKQVGDAESNTKRRAEAEESQEPFDFSSVPNILDDDPEAEREETEKRRKRQKKTVKKGL